MITITITLTLTTTLTITISPILLIATITIRLACSDSIAAAYFCCRASALQRLPKLTFGKQGIKEWIGLFPLTVTVTTRSNRNYNRP